MQKDTDHQQPIGKTSATIEPECSESKTKQPSANATVRTKGPVAFEYHMYHIHQIALLIQFALLSNWIYNPYSITGSSLLKHFFTFSTTRC
jgi:hypothetical protein